MSLIVTLMGKKADRHKTKQVNLRLPEVFRKQIEKLCEKNVTTITGEIITAIRERLERNELWPPPANGKRPPASS